MGRLEFFFKVESYSGNGTANFRGDFLFFGLETVDLGIG